VDVPHLRIVNDALWSAVRARQEGIRHDMSSVRGSGTLNKAHRARSLLAGLIRCGVCGGGYTLTGTDRNRCATRRSKGTCDNAGTIGRRDLEGRIFAGLKDRLMAPELIREFMDPYQKEVNRAASQRQSQVRAAQSRIDGLDRKIMALVVAIENGQFSQALSDRLAALENEKSKATAAVTDEPAPVLRMHPKLPDIYAAKVAELEAVLNDPGVCGEANELLRGLIEFVEVQPGDSGEPVRAILHGDLARILALGDTTANIQKCPPAGAGGHVLSVVAGTGFEPVTFRL
jgi:site-specific DNA recombinase